MDRRTIIKYMASITGCDVKVNVEKGVMYIKLVDNIDGQLVYCVSQSINGKLISDVQKQLTDELFNKLIVPGKFNN